MRRNSGPDDSQPVQDNIPVPNSVEEEIINKCPTEEMMRTFFKDYVIIWHDPQEDQKYTAQLKRFCEVFTFTEWEKVKDYIKNTQAGCHVITSGTNGELLVNEVSESENVCNIYIFCENKELHSSWTQTYKKVSCIETNIQNIIDQIQQNLMEWYKKSSSLNLNLPAFAPTLNDSEINHPCRSLRIIPDSQSREQAKDDLLQLSRRIYSDPINAELLEEFQKDYNELDIPASDPVAQPIEKEIILKCSLEEMMRAFFKDYAIVWHDPNVNNEENQQYIAQLKRFCDVPTFIGWEKVKDYIQSAQAACHVITSGTNGELLVKEISTSQSVENIYIFCTNKEYHSGWAQKYSKISCLETNIQNLIDQIQQNLMEWYKEASSLNLNLPAFAPIFNDTDKSEMNNLHRYMKVIPNFKNREQAKEDFVTLSRRIYSDPINTKLLEEFKKDYNEYNKEKTLKWYTRESFLYKVTNNCLRIATPDSIQYCRLLLKDIEQAIKDQYQEKSKNFSGLLYRGAYLSQEEWSSLKENQDKEIEMHGFLSASKVKQVGLNFMNSDPNKKVFITIMVPRGLNEEEQGFAEMDQYSQYPQEKEVLFNVRSRFTVLETEDDYEYSGTSKCRHLVLLYGAQGFRRFISEVDLVQEVPIPSIESISCTHCHVINEAIFFVSIVYLEKYYCKACIGYGVGPFLCVSPKVERSGTAKIRGCVLVMRQGQEKTPFYGYKCSQCQAKKEKSYFVCTDCHYKKWCENCSDSKTLDCLTSGHNVILERRPFSFWYEEMSAEESDHLEFQNDLVAKGNDIFQHAEMYFESQKYDKAIEYYSLYIKENEAKGKDINLAMSYHNIGLIYDEQGEYKKALEYYFKSVDIQKSVYGGDNHPSVARSYGNIGTVFDNQGKYNKALEYHWKSLDIKKSVYEENHPSIASSFHNIGSVYDNQEEYEKALEYYLKGLEILRSVNGDNHPSIANSFNSIGMVYKNIAPVKDNHEEYTKALEYLFKALDIRKSIYGDSHSSVANSYNNIGLIYNDQGEYNKALEYHWRSLDIRKSVYEENHPLMATSYNNIGMVYRNIALVKENHEEYTKALEYLLKALGIRKPIYGDSHPLVAISYNNIGGVYENQEEYAKALEYYLKALEIRKSVYGDNHPSTIKTQDRILKIQSIHQNSKS